MIITVTLNPALDKTLEVQGFAKGKLNRVENISTAPGGKGINVSIKLKELGEPNVAIGFFGGSAGFSIAGNLNLNGVRTEQVIVQGETRTNMKIVSGNELTEINEPGPKVNENDLERLNAAIEKYAVPGNIFVFSGSVPMGVDDKIYYRLINMVKAKGAIAILDADGDVFREGMKAVPYAIKPNIHELFEYRNEEFGGTIPEDYMDYVVEYSSDFIKAGVKLVCVSLGPDGAYFTDGVNNMFAPPLDADEIHRNVGDGDSMVAALAYSIAHGLDFDQTTELAMKAAAGGRV